MSRRTRRLRLPRFVRRHLGRQRQATAAVRVLRTVAEIRAAMFGLMRREYAAPADRRWLEALLARDTTTLLVQADGYPGGDLVLARTGGAKVIASVGDRFVEAETWEPSANGAYLVERQYRQLGFHEVPPSERALILVQFANGASTYRVDVPGYVERATVVVDRRLLAADVELPATGELRYRLG